MMYSGTGHGTAVVFSILAIAAGAVMYWAITVPVHGFRLSTIGVVLMLAGAAGLLISTVLFASARAGNRRSSLHRRTVDAQGNETLVHEEVR
jgi:hypothetical protein